MSVEERAVAEPGLFPSRSEDGLSTDLIRQVADRLPAVTLVASAPDFRIVYANAAAYREARSAPGDLAGKLAAEVFAFVDPALLIAGPPAQAHAVATPNGDATRWWDVSYVALDTGGWAPPSVLITASDVTDHQVAKLKAQAAQDTLDALLAYIPEGISIAHGPEVVVDHISARGMALVGRDAQALTGRSALQQTDVWEVYRPGSDIPLSPEDRPLARATRTGEMTLSETLIVRRADGGWLTVVCNSGPILDAAGRVTGAVMAWQDVGELRRAQAGMRESEERLRAVLLQVPAAIFILEAPDGRVTFKSRMLDDVLGDLDAEVGQAQATLRGWATHPDGSPYQLSEYPSRRALRDGETVRAEPMVFRRADGRVIDLEMYAGPVHGEDGEIIAAVAVAMDVTDRRQADARQGLLFRLEESLRALSDPGEILGAAATILGRYLGAGRVGYGEMQPDDETLLITNGYVDGAPPISGLFPLSMLDRDSEAQLRQGRPIVYDDALANDLGGRNLGLEFGTRAHVAVPLIRDGRLTGSFYVTHFKPYTWGPAEIALIEDVAARIWDAAERGRVEARLRENEERLRLVMESTGLGAWEYDVDTRTAIRSARHDAIFGYAEPVSAWSYEQFTSHIHEDDRETAEAGFRAALEQGQDWNVECRMIRADGSPGWIQVRARPHFGADGRIIRLLGTVADISDRKQAEDAARETAAKFETLAQTVPNMVWASLPDGQIDWFNARVPEYCGVPADDMMPDGWSPVHPDDMARSTRLWQEALASGEPYDAEYRIRRHDGVYRWHLTRAIPIRGADGTIMRWIGASADIQDQKSSEQALADLNATLERQVRERTEELLAAEATLRQSQKMEAVGQLTGGLAHDFNNLLTGITGSLELMATRLDQGRTAELDRYVDIARGAAQRAAALTHRLLAFSRRQTLDPKPTDINRLVGGMDELIRRTVGPAVKVEVVGPLRLWAVLADPNQLENALLNLCLNARDAMPGGGRLTVETGNQVLDEAQAKTLELPAGEYAVLSVRDTGGGMTADVIARAFDPFYTTKPIGEGTGLGLSMVYGFVRQSGGQAQIRSQPGQGTEVSLYLPRYQGEAEALGASGRLRRPNAAMGKPSLWWTTNQACVC